MRLVIQDRRGCREIPLDRLPIRLGSRNDNHVVLDAVGVARQHAVVCESDGRLQVRDLGGGMRVDGAPLAAATLRDRALIRLGEARLLVRSGNAPPPIPLVLADVDRRASLRRVRGLVHRALAERGGVALDRDALTARVSTLVDEGCMGLGLRAKVRRRIVDDVVFEATGRGPLDGLLADPTVREITIDAPGEICVERADGRRRRVEARFRDRAHLMSALQLLTPAIEAPLLRARLGDGTRVDGVLPPVAVRGPAVVIRKPPVRRPPIGALVRLGALPAALARDLVRYVRERRAIVISGAAGAGKTTLLAALARAIPTTERLVTVEEVHELALGRGIALECRDASQRRILSAATRLRPDRLVVGECVGAEALAILRAMSGGCPGSMTTLRAHSVTHGLRRLRTLAGLAGDAPQGALDRLIGEAVDLWIHVVRAIDGQRRIAAVARLGPGPIARVVWRRDWTAGIRSGSER